MLNVSTKWNRAVVLDNDINVCCFADIVTTNGEKIPIDDSKLWANGFEVSDATSSDGIFTIGALIVGKLKLKLNNIYEEFSTYDFNNASVDAYVGKRYSDGTLEKVKVGHYTVNETSYDSSFITLTCLDNINKFNSQYNSTLDFPATAYEVIIDACAKCGVAFNMKDFANSDFTIEAIPDGQNYTFGQVIAFILQICGSWGKCGHDGELVIGWYDMTQVSKRNYTGGTFSTKTTPYSDGDSLDGGTFSTTTTPYSDGDSVDDGYFTDARDFHNIFAQKDINASTDDVVITGVKVIVTSKEDKSKDVSALSGKEGYVVAISDNPLITTDKAQSIADFVFKKIGGMRFRPLQAKLLSNPVIESGDVALVTDRKQNTFTCFISQRTFTVSSGTTISCDAQDAPRNSADKFSNETKAIVKSRETAKAQVNAYDTKVQSLTELMSTSMGLFKTPQVQEDGSIIYIMHNKADLNSSNIQWKMTANGVAVSSDYGKTWNAGIDKNGNATFNVMSAVGILFDWAKGGTLTLGGENNVSGKQYVKDANGRTLVTLDNKGITLDDKVSISLNGHLSDSKIDLKATDNSGNNYELWMNGAVLRIIKNGENMITLYGTTGAIGAHTVSAQEIQSDKFRENDRGYAMCGDTTGHVYHCLWDDTALQFQVDDTWVWSSSDKRLKKNIEAINQDYIDAVGSVDLFQYNLNRQGYSDKPLYFGAMAQDIIENLKDKGHVDESLDMIFQNKATSDDDTLYYGMNYEQFLILRLAGDEQKIDKMQNHIDELEDKFSRLCRKLGIDESEV